MRAAHRAWASRAVGLILAVLLDAGAAAEPVSLRPHWKVGDERRYDLSAEYRQTAPDEQGHDAERRVTQEARLVLHVDEVDAAGQATVKVTFESLHVEQAEPGYEAEVFDWKAGGTAPPAGDEASVMVKLSTALVGCTMSADVGPEGTVTSVTGLVPLAQALQQLGGDTPSLRCLGFFSPVRLRANLSMLWRVDPEGRARELGAQWRTAEHLTLGEAYAADATTAWTLAAGEGAMVKFSGAVTLATAANKRESDPAAPRLEIKEQQGKIAADWDVAGVLVGRVDDLSATWTATVELGPGAATPNVVTESKATSHVELKLVK